MDRLEQKLQEDAKEIRPTVSPEISDRIMARVKDTPQKRVAEQRAQPHFRWWWASSLTGLAAAVTLLAVINWSGGPATDAIPDSTSAQTVPQPVDIFANPLPLQLRRATVTAPLEQELERLESDLEKARDLVRDDLRIVL